MKPKDLTQPPEISLPVEILIISFDGYADVWDLSITSFFKYWPDCPFRINLLTNWKEYPDPRINSLCIGQDTDWSSNLQKGLSAIRAPYVLTLFDDLILKDRIDTEQVLKFISVCIRNQYDYLRLRPSPPPDGNEFSDYGSLKPGASYRVSLCTAVVKRETLISLLQPGENAWDFEKFGSLRSSDRKDFYSTKQQIIPYFNAIEKGGWNKTILSLLNEKKMESGQRGIFHEKKKSFSLGRLKHFIVFSIMPVPVRKLFYYVLKKIG